MARLLKRDVDRAHDQWAIAAGQWGDNNLETARRAVAYYRAKAEWEEKAGKPYQRGSRRA